MTHTVAESKTVRQIALGMQVKEIKSFSPMRELPKGVKHPIAQLQDYIHLILRDRGSAQTLE